MLIRSGNNKGKANPSEATTAPLSADKTPTTKETTPATIPETVATEPPTEQKEEWTSLGTFKLTAYCPCEDCCGYWATIRPTDENGNPIVYTASGAIAEAGTTIAVDPNIIPYGSKVKINDHIYIAQDTGGAIVGNCVDIYFDNHQEALVFGVQYAEVLISATN